MTDPPLARWLGIDAEDPGCEAVFDALDRYVEAVLRGERGVGDGFASLLVHAVNCLACREDIEGLVAASRHPESRPPAARAPLGPPLPRSRPEDPPR